MTCIVIGVLGALAVAVVGAGLKWGRTAFEAIMQRFRPDRRGQLTRQALASWPDRCTR